MSNTYWKKGEHNAVCDSCGVVFKSSKLKKNWQGFYLCKDDYEERHPIEFIKGVPENNNVPFVRPNDHASDITVTDITDSASGITLSASNSLNIFYYTTYSAGNTFGRYVTLPAAANATFQGCSIVYSVTLLSSYAGNTSLYPAAILATGSDQIIGNNLIPIGSTAKFRNVPGDNIWIRES